MSGGTHPRRLEERERLAALKAEGLSLRAIAARLGRFVRERLLEGWTPEQIAGWLEAGRGARAARRLPETIHTFLHRARAEGREALEAAAARARQAGQAAGSRAALRHRRAALHPRPARGRPGALEAGHWEGDLLICKRTRPVLVLKERKTRFVLAARLAGKSAAETVAVMMAVFRRLDPRLRCIDHVRQRHRVRPARAAGERLRHGDLVLRRLRLLAERSGGERQRPAAARPAARPRPRRAQRRGAAGDRPEPQPPAYVARSYGSAGPVAKEVGLSDVSCSGEPVGGQLALDCLAAGRRRLLHHRADPASYCYALTSSGGEVGRGAHGQTLLPGGHLALASTDSAARVTRGPTFRTTSSAPARDSSRSAPGRAPPGAAPATDAAAKRACVPIR